MENYKISYATASDLDAVLEIMNYAILHTTAVYDHDAKDRTFIEEWYKQRVSADCPVLICICKNEVVAYATYTRFRPKNGYKYSVEHSLYIKPGFQGKGIGTNLLKTLISIARKKGMHCMIAGIDASNEQSILLHRKLGFTHAGLLKEAGYKFGKWLDLSYFQLILQ